MSAPTAALGYIYSWRDRLSPGVPRGEAQRTGLRWTDIRCWSTRRNDISSVAGSGPVPVLEVIFRGLRTEDRTGPPPTTRTGTGTAVLIGLRRTAVRSSVRTGPGLHGGPDQSWTSKDQSLTGPVSKFTYISVLHARILTFYISLESHNPCLSKDI